MRHIPFNFHLGRLHLYLDLKLGRGLYSGPRFQFSVEEGGAYWDQTKFLSAFDFIFLLPFISLGWGFGVQRQNLLTTSLVPANLVEKPKRPEVVVDVEMQPSFPPVQTKEPKKTWFDLMKEYQEPESGTQRQEIKAAEVIPNVEQSDTIKDLNQVESETFLCNAEIVGSNPLQFCQLPFSHEEEACSPIRPSDQDIKVVQVQPKPVQSTSIIPTLDDLDLERAKGEGMGQTQSSTPPAKMSSVVPYRNPAGKKVLVPNTPEELRTYARLGYKPWVEPIAKPAPVVLSSPTPLPVVPVVDITAEVATMNQFGIWNGIERHWEPMSDGTHPFKDDRETADKHLPIFRKLSPQGRFLIKKHHPNCKSDTAYCCEGEVLVVADTDRQFGVWNHDLNEGHGGWTYVNTEDRYKTTRKTAEKQVEVLKDRSRATNYSVRKHFCTEPQDISVPYVESLQRCCVGDPVEPVKKSETVSEPSINYGVWDMQSRTWAYSLHALNYRMTQKTAQAELNHFTWGNNIGRFEIRRHDRECWRAKGQWCCLGIPLETKLPVESKEPANYGVWYEKQQRWVWMSQGSPAPGYHGTKQSAINEQAKWITEKATVRKHATTCVLRGIIDCCVGELLVLPQEEDASFGIWALNGHHWAHLGTDSAPYRGTQSTLAAKLTTWKEKFGESWPIQFRIAKHDASCQKSTQHNCCKPVFLPQPEPSKSVETKVEPKKSQPRIALPTEDVISP